MAATAGRRWQAVAAVVAVVVAVMVGQAASHDARAVEPKDLGARTASSTDCTSTATVVTLSPGDTYTFTSPGFPKS